MFARAGAFALRYRTRHRGRFDTPMVLSFLVTGRCQLRCKHCFYHYAPTDRSAELTLDEYRQLSAHLDPFAIGLFCGGEPFIRPDLAEIVRLFHDHNGMLVALVSTNGQDTEAVVAQTRAIVQACPSAAVILSFSIDGAREAHDQTRGKGTFDRALRTWEACRPLAAANDNLHLGISTVLTALNQAQLPAFLDWAWATLQPETIGVLAVRQSPRAGDALKGLDPGAYARAQAVALRPLLGSRLRRLTQPQSLYFGAMAAGVDRTLRTGERSFFCHAGRHGALVGPTGELHLCEVLAEQSDLGELGNLRQVEMDFSALWNGAEATRLRGHVGQHQACAACTHETMGYLPSLLFPPNGLGTLWGDRAGPASESDL